MPELLKISEIKGLNSDIKPWDLPPEYLSHAINYRVVDSTIIASGGNAIWATAPINFNPSHVINVASPSGDYWLVVGRSAVYAFDGTTWTDVSSAVGYAGLGIDDELLWTETMLGRIPIINNPQSTPEYWPAPISPSTPMLPLPFDQVNTWSDKGYSFKILRSHKNFLFALNLSEGANEFPNGYRWSHPADLGFIPVTWDEFDESFLAGKADLAGDGGSIIDGQSLRDAFCIYSEEAIDILDSTGDEFVFRRRKLSSTVGLLSRECIVEIKGDHFFLADGDIVKNDGTRIDSIAHKRIRKQINSRISIDNYQRSYAVRNDAKKEVWFCIPEEDATYASVAYIYNYRDDSWAVRDIREADNISYAAYGSKSVPVDKWDNFPDSVTWDSIIGTWGSVIGTPLDDTIVGASPVNGALYFLDPTAPEGELETRLERTDFPLVDQRQVTTITRVYPHMDGDLPVSIQFGSQDHAGSPVRWKPAVTFNPSTDRKIDVRTTGELHCWRYDSIGMGGFEITGMDIEFELAGLR